MRGSPEPDVLEAARRGDRAAFDSLFASVEGEARRILGLQLGGRGDADPDAALQDLRIYVFEKLAIYDPAYPFAVFVRGLARTIGLRHRAAKAAGSPVSEEGEPGVPGDGVPPALGRGLGVDRFAPPDRGSRLSPAFRELLELLYRDGGYPHQVIAFSFSVVVWGRPGRSGARVAGVTGDPDRVVESLAGSRLREAVEELLLALVLEGGLFSGDAERFLAPLHERMDHRVEEMFAGDGRSLRLFAGLHGRLVGDTRLEEYFGSDPRKSVTDWSHGVKRRLVSRLEGGMS